MDVAEKTATILVVEDDVNLLEGIRNVLELEDYCVYTATDGLEALDVLRKLPTPPDLIVSDIMMPHLDGIELLQKVRQVDQWVSIPFVYLTARGEKRDIQRGKQLGVDDYVIKPYEPADLLITVQSRLERYRTLRALHTGRMYELKERILTILNHEFRTPLTMVVAYSDIIQEYYTDQVADDELVTFLKGVGTGADRLRHLIENFILLVELETGEALNVYNLLKKPVAAAGLQALLQQTCAEMSRRFPDTACQIDMPDTLPVIVAHDAYLRQMLHQLTDNACKFSPYGAPVRVAVTAGAHELCIAVQDQGRGIHPDELAHIWESFYQIDRETYEDQGAGCGLAIARGLAELHGGRITVDSAPSKGSIFTIHLPVQA